MIMKKSAKEKSVKDFHNIRKRASEKLSNKEINNEIKQSRR